MKFSGTDVAPETDVEAHERRLSHISRAFEFVPHSLYNEITKLGEGAVGEFIDEIARLRSLLLRAESKGVVMGAGVDYERAYREAKRILTPGRGRGTVAGDTDNWRLARAQWHYDHGSRALAERELGDINRYRAARDRDKPGSYPPLDLKREKHEH
ncbi:MAG: hypothetical protein H0U18_15250 [Pyrinomonadaceae bacterium]|nr:hypothetical protein [Pyrinomonadaceae bacterium]